jgi:erythritol/L-threitol dehydrogenase
LIDNKGVIIMNLPDKMKAIVCYAPEDYRIEEVNRPKAGKEEVIIKIGACGICASDLKAYHGAEMVWGGDDPFLKGPVIPGHEFYGYVVEMGKGAGKKYNIKIGDRITAEQIVPCEKCRFCRQGKYWMCEVHNIYGFQKDVADGGMAEYMKLGKTSRIHKIPETLSAKEAALIEPMSCAAHAVQRADIDFEDTVVLAGAGSLGLCMVQLIALKTPKKLIVLDLEQSKLEKAKKLGADICINPAKKDAVKEVKKMTDGYGSDVYIEATGSTSGVTQGLDMIRKLGRFVEFSVFRDKTTVDWSIIGDRKELDLRGAHLSPYTYPIVINLFERGLVGANEIITHTYKIDDFNEAIAMADSKESVKVLIEP